MKSRKIALVAVSCAALGLVIGCSKAPQQEVEAAKSAISSAQQAEADKYVADKMQAANDSLNAALAEIEKQNSGFALSRNYAGAKAKLQAATQLADEAKASAATAKEQVKAEVDSSLAATQASLQEARQLLDKAPKGKEGREALTAMSDELTAVEASLNEASAGIAAGDYIGARDKINAGAEKISTIKQEVTQAIEKTGAQ